LGLNASDITVGIVAAFTEHKALNYFVDVAKKVHDRIPQVRFLMVGDGELRPEIEKQIAQLKIRQVVQLLGWRSDIPEIIATFDVFLLTSLWEGLPRALVEALLTGVPAVASNVDGVCEVLRHGENGYLVPPGDIEAMAQSVVRLLTDAPLRLSMDERCRSSVTAFSLPKMLQDHTNFYRNLRFQR
ncbi:MAG: glycosyltransferase, partial [Pyrinomonadaceae bacterium]